MRKIFILTLILIGLFNYSCGYSVYKKADLPFKEIYLRKVENLTLEPGLQDRLRKIAFQSLNENGFIITQSADKILDIEIMNYRLITLSEIGLTTVEYQVNLDIKASLYDDKGNLIKEFYPSTPFITTFRTKRDLQRVLVERNLAIESLMRDICDDIARRLIFIR